VRAVFAEEMHRAYRMNVPVVGLEGRHGVVELGAGAALLSELPAHGLFGEEGEQVHRDADRAGGATSAALDAAAGQVHGGTMWYSRLPMAWLATGIHCGRLQSMVQRSQ